MMFLDNKTAFLIFEILIIFFVNICKSIVNQPLKYKVLPLLCLSYAFANIVPLTDILYEKDIDKDVY